MVTALLGLVIGAVIWLRVGYEPDSGSHRIGVEHVDAADPASGGVADSASDGVDGSASNGAADSEAGGFDPFVVRVERPDGVSVGVEEAARTGWQELSFGLSRSTPRAGPLVVAGQMTPTVLVDWAASGAGRLRISVDGTQVDEVVTDGPSEGVVPIDFPMRVPRTTILLFAVFVVWGLVIAHLLVVAWSRSVQVSGRSNPRRHLVRLVAGGSVVSALIVLLLPVDPPAVVRYEVIVQPLDVMNLNVALLDGGGEVRDTVPLAIPDSWQGVAGDVSTPVATPLRWSFVGSPADRLMLGAFPEPGTAEVRVNGRSSVMAVETGRTVANTTALSDLGAPTSRLDRVILAASRIGDVVAVSIVLVGAWLAVDAFRHRRRAKRRAEPVPAMNDRSARVRSPWFDVARFAAFPLAVWTTLLVVFWPGLMNPDSVTQWRQLDESRLRDWHPYPVNVAFGVSRWIIDSPFLPTLAIAFAVAVMVGLVATWAVREGAPGWAGWSVAVGVAVAPVTSIMTVSLWKDVIMGVGVLALAIVIWRLEITGGRWLALRRRHMVFAVGACLVVWLSRHNGWPIVVLSLAAVVILRRDARRSVLTVLAITTLIAVVVRVPLKNALDVEESPVATTAALQRVAAHVNAGTEIDPADRDFLTSLRPLDEQWPYDCQSVQATWFGPQSIPMKRYVDESGRLQSIWVGLALRDPRVELDHIACSSQILWKVTDRGTYTYFLDGNTASGFVDTIPSGDGKIPLEAQPSRQLARGVFDFYQGLPSPLIRPALYTYVLFGLAVAVAIRRRSLGALLAVSPAIVQTVTFVPVALVQDTRFQYGAILVAVVASPLLVAELRRPSRPIGPRLLSAHVSSRKIGSGP